MGLQEYRRARSEAKRAALLEAGIALFQRHGYARAGMEEIARTAGVSTATLYRHFPSKADLFEAVASASMDRLEARLPQRGASPLARLQQLARGYAEMLSRPQTRAVMRMLVAETGRSPELAERFYAAVKQRLGDVFEEAVRAAVDQGLARSAALAAPAAGQLQGMIEHATLLRGLILGDEAPPADDPARLADEALTTWLARWGDGAS